MSLRFDGASLQVLAPESDGWSILLLPLEFSRCLDVVAPRGASLSYFEQTSWRPAILFHSHLQRDFVGSNGSIPEFGVRLARLFRRPRATQYKTSFAAQAIRLTLRAFPVRVMPLFASAPALLTTYLAPLLSMENGGYRHRPRYLSERRSIDRYLQRLDRADPRYSVLVNECSGPSPGSSLS